MKRPRHINFDTQGNKQTILTSHPLPPAGGGLREASITEYLSTYAIVMTNATEDYFSPIECSIPHFQYQL